MDKARYLSLGNFINKYDNLLQLLVITMVIFGIMSTLNPEKFLRYYNFDSIAFSFPELGLLSIAIMVTMLSGGIDLSVVGIANLTAILAGKLFQVAVQGQNLPEGTVLLYILLALAIVLIGGLVAGLLNGFLVTKAGITPILATLGTGQLFTGIALVLTGGPAIVGFPEMWSWIGNGKLFGLAVPCWLFAVTAVCIAVLLNKTSFGIKLMLIGTNPKAALYSGIINSRIILRSYMLSGVLAALTGIIMSGRTNAAKSDYGSSYVLQAVLVAVLAGTNPAGGYGTVLGIFIAVIALMFLSSGLQIMRFSNFLVDFIWGAFLLLIMVINFYMQKKHSRR
ncbi:MAG: ABC transporter permease [Deltaproteobacteria bacterium]|nr:MAG: ABC transporter permease [Deltaproteobacteria bacterium]